MKKLKTLLLGLTVFCSAFLLGSCGGTNEEEPSSCSHNWGEGVVTTQATHTTEGERKFTCSLCNETKTEVIPAEGHDSVSQWTTDENKHWHACSCGAKLDEADHTWNAGVDTALPTHTEDGVKTFSCTMCGATKTEAIPALGHNVSKEWSKNDTKHWHECSCGYKEDEADHTWDNGVVTKDPSCLHEGEILYTCTACGQTKVEPIAKLAHVEGAEQSFAFHYTLKSGETFGPELKNADDIKALFINENFRDFEVSNWSKVYGQAQSGSTYNTYDVIKFGTGSANGTLTITFSDYVSKVVVKAANWTDSDTLTINGEKKTLNNKLTAELHFEEFTFEFANPTKEVNVLAENRIIISELKVAFSSMQNYVAPTCTTAGGYDIKHICSVCNTTLKPTEHVDLPALEHVCETLIPEVASTCVATGVVAHYHCPACDKDIAEDKTTILNAEDLVIAINPNAHDFGDLIPEVPATCTEDGTKAHYVCANCGKWFDEEKAEHEEAWFVISSAGAQHQFGDVIPEVKATCTTDGHSAYKVCAICTEKEGYEFYPATGHNYVQVQGEEYYECTNEGCNSAVVYVYETFASEDIKDGTQFILSGVTSGNKKYGGAFGSNTYFTAVDDIKDAVMLTLKASDTEGVWYILSGNQYLKVTNPSSTGKLAWSDTPYAWKLVIANNAYELQIVEEGSKPQLGYNASSPRFGNYASGTQYVGGLLAYKPVELIDITSISITNPDTTEKYEVGNYFTPTITLNPEDATAGYNFVIADEFKEYFKVEDGKVTILKQDEAGDKEVSFKVVAKRGGAEASYSFTIAKLLKHTITVEGLDKVTIDGVTSGDIVDTKTTIQFTVEGKTGYTVTEVKVGTNVLTPNQQGKYVYCVQDDITITITTEELPKVLVTVTENANATISIETGEYYTNTPVTFTVTPQEGYVVQSVVFGTTTLEDVEGVYTITPVEATTLSVTVISDSQEYSVSYTANENAIVIGIESGTPVSKKAGETFSFTVEAHDGFEIVAVKANGEALTGSEGSYEFTVLEDTVITIETQEKAKEQVTYTYNFSSKDWKATLGDASKNWTSGKDGGQFSANQGIQVTASNTGVNGTCNESYTNISKIVINYCTNASKGAGSIVVTIGNTVVSADVKAPSSGGTTRRDLVFELEVPVTGNVNITVNCSANSIYIWSCAITAD